jgi:hypothetical protein
MATATGSPTFTPPVIQQDIRAQDVVTSGVPWYLWMGALAVTCSSMGGAWDVAWHRSIGRDTFWTPAHMVIYACGVLAGIVGLWLVAQGTFGKDDKVRAVSVRVLGLRAPLGVFLAGWGGMAMLTSAPFDNWWHAAYGLDVKIVSPPHTLLMFGVYAVSIGMLLLILSTMNRALEGHHSNFKTLRALLLYVGALMVCEQMFFLQEATWDITLHRAASYIAMAAMVPVLLAMLSQASRFRWAATTISAVYSILTIAQILIFPLFHAQPKLGPVFYPVTHLVPTKFPLLILVPSFVLDILWQKMRACKPWQIAVTSGIVFVLVLVVVQWPFANFLMSHASQNRFFGTGYFDYGSRANGFDRMRQFFHPEHGWVLWSGLLRAMFYAMLSTFVGFSAGGWMRGVKR